jgi:uncharacterized protein with HEPN domain
VWQDKEVVADMIQASQRIQLFVIGMSAEEFMADTKTQAAVQFQLLVLGEAAKRVSESLRTKYPAIPWSPMARMRDKLIHSYELVSLEEVWRTATGDIPALLVQLEELLSNEP